MEINTAISQYNTSSHYQVGKWLVLAICGLAYALVAYYYNVQITDKARVVHSYSANYIYLVGAINHQDIDDFIWLDSARISYPISEKRYYFLLDKNGKKYITRAPGMSACYLPAYAIGTISANALGYPTDGLSKPYVVAVAVQNLLVVLFGIWAMYTLLASYFKPLAVFISCIGFGVLTPLLECVSAKEHSYFYLFTLLSIVILCSHYFYKKPSIWYAIAIGVCTALAISIEFSAAFFIIIPFSWLISYRPHHIKARVFHVLRYGSYYIVILLLSSLGSIIHLIYYQYTTRLWSFYNYDSRKFGWFWSNISEGLFSFNFGWILYTPIIILSLIGFVTLAFFHIRLFVFTMIGLVLGLLAVFMSDVSNLSTTIGNSYMLGYSALLLFPLTSLVQSVVSYTYSKLMLYLILIWLSVYNFWLVANHINLNFVPNEGISPAYFWARILRDANQEGVAKLLDTDFNHTDTLYNEQLLQANPYTYCLTKKKQIIPRMTLDWTYGQKMVRCYLEAKPEQTQVAPWRYAQLLISFYTNGKNTHNSLMRIQRHTLDGQWTKLYLDAKVPNNTTEVHVSLWNADNSERICIRKIRLVGYDVENKDINNK